jgi:ribonuclease BN (tRNA processing enzyme)
MRVLFLGVGEAFDETLPNNSHLILSDSNILLDCGYSVPQFLWKYNPDQSFLDAIYISHRHADHYFGLPPVIVRMWECKRTKPLTLICPQGMKRDISNLIKYGYETILKRIEFDVNFTEVRENQSIRFNELTLSFAPTSHSAKNFAIRIDDGKNSVCYSGDGTFNKKTERLYFGSDLVIHEAYSLDRHIPGHANIKELIEMAKRNEVKCLALTHLQRDFRKNEVRTLGKDISDKAVKIIIPEPLTEYVF